MRSTEISEMVWMLLPSSRRHVLPKLRSHMDYFIGKSRKQPLIFFPINIKQRSCVRGDNTKITKYQKGLKGKARG